MEDISNKLPPWGAKIESEVVDTEALSPITDSVNSLELHLQQLEQKIGHLAHKIRPVSKEIDFSCFSKLKELDLNGHDENKDLSVLRCRIVEVDFCNFLFI